MFDDIGVCEVLMGDDYYYVMWDVVYVLGVLFVVDCCEFEVYLVGCFECWGVVIEFCGVFVLLF